MYQKLKNFFLVSFNSVKFFLKIWKYIFYKVSQNFKVKSKYIIAVKLFFNRYKLFKIFHFLLKKTFIKFCRVEQKKNYFEHLKNLICKKKTFKNYIWH